MKKNILRKICAHRSQITGLALAAILSLFPVDKGFSATYEVGTGKTSPNLETLLGSVLIRSGDEIILFNNDFSLLSPFNPPNYTQEALTIRSDSSLERKITYAGVQYNVPANTETNTSSQAPFLNLLGGTVKIGEHIVLTQFSNKYDGGAAKIGQNAILQINGSEALSNSSSLSGGVVYSEWGTLQSNNSKFGLNQAHRGGVYYALQGTALLTNSDLYSNTAITGGTVYLEQGSLLTDGSQFLFNTAIGSTSELGNGGAVVLSNSTGQLKNTNFLGNSAAGHGGAVYFTGNSTLNIRSDQKQTSIWMGNNDNSGANSIYFDLNSAPGQNVSQQLMISGEGTTEMFDPIRAEKTTGVGSNLTISKADTGKWILSGASNLSGADLTATLSVAEGTFELAKDASLEIGMGTFTVKSGATLAAKGENTIKVGSLSLADKAIILESDAKIEINMAAGGTANTPLLTLEGKSALSGILTIDVTSVNAFTGDGTYQLLSLTEAGFNKNNTNLLIGGGKSTSSANDRVGTRTFGFADTNFDGLNDVITLTLANVDANRTVLWQGTTNHLWSETAQNWKNNDNASKYFLNGDTVGFDKTNLNETVAVQIDDAGVAVDIMSVLGQYQFTGGDISGNQLIFNTGTAGTGSSIKFDTRTWKLETIVSPNTKAGLIAKDEETLTVTNAKSVSAVTGSANTTFSLGQTESTGTIIFQNNSDSTDSGGAIQGGSIQLLGGSNSFIGNSAREYGGALAANTLNIRGGSAKFENNSAGSLGGAIYVAENAVLEALNGAVDGDIVFRNNTQGTERTSNAVYMANEGLNKSLTLRTETGRSITFYDAIESNASSSKFNVHIIGSGVTQFIKQTSNIHGTTSVANGATMQLSEGAVFGAATDNPQFILRSQGTLLVDSFGNKIQATDIELEKDSIIRINLATGDTTGQAASLQLIGQTSLPTDGTINIDTVGPSRDGLFKLIQTTTNITGKVTATLNGQSPAALTQNDRKGKHEFTVDLNALYLKQYGYDMNRTITWTGEQSNVWDDETANWFVPEKLSRYFLNGDIVKFDYTGTNKDIDIASNGVIVGGVNVDCADISFNGGSLSAITDGKFRTLDKHGYGTLSLNQQNFFDQVRVYSGTLAGGGDRASLDSTIVGDLLVAYTGKLSPGGSGVKTFRVDGNIQFQDGSYLYLDLGNTASTSDLLTATGTINFDSDMEGTTTIVVSGKNIPKGEVSTKDAVIHADGGLLLNGQALKIGKTNVSDETVTIRRGGSKIVIYSDETLTLRSASVIDDGHELSIDALGSGRKLPTIDAFSWNQLLALSSLESSLSPSFANSLLAKYALTETYDKPHFLEAILPTINSAMPLVAQREITQFRQISFGRLQFLNEMKASDYHRIIEGNPIRDGLKKMTTRGQRFCANAAPILWAQNYGDFLHQSKRSVQGFQSDSYGIAIGTDKWIDQNMVVGMGFGGTFANVKTSDRLQRGESNAFILSFYGSYRKSNGVKFLGSLGYTYNHFDLHRTPGGIPISSKHSGDIFFADLEISQTMHGTWTDITPFINFDLVTLGERAYNEKNIYGSTVSKIDKQDTTSFLQTLGARFGRTRTNYFGWIVNPSWWIGWVHDYGDGNVSTVAQYTGGTPFRIQGMSMNQDRIGFGLNYNAAVNRQFSFFGGYNGEFADRFNAHTIQAGFTFEF